MGSLCSTRYRQEVVAVQFFGIDHAGKTTLLYRLKLGEVVSTIGPVFGGNNTERINHNGNLIDLREAPTRSRMRFMYSIMVKHVHAVVFVVDSADHERLQEAVDEFFQMIVPDVVKADIPVLVLANKQDKEDPLTPEFIKETIYSRKETKPACMEVFPSVATTLDGIDPALDWLTSQIALKMAKKAYLPSKEKVLRFFNSKIMSHFVRSN